ncbi:helix-turn-helix domain-containing protein [Nonomuraea bangladeshensis]|uniref:Helix-turn-helix domain-containing protein n=1 Tax=Nonomuraea bangladeshensis TaxID=404385 RepID=A0ABV3H4P8_9ACTN
MSGRPERVLRSRTLLLELMAAGRHNTVTLARQAGVRKQLISYLTSGRRTSCSAATAERIAATLGCQEETLFSNPLEEESSTREEGEMVHTIQEACDALRMSKSTVYRLISKGDLSTTDVSPTGSKKAMRRVPESAIREFLAKRTSQA